MISGRAASSVTILKQPQQPFNATPEVPSGAKEADRMMRILERGGGLGIQNLIHSSLFFSSLGAGSCGPVASRVSGCSFRIWVGGGGTGYPSVPSRGVEQRPVCYVRGIPRSLILWLKNPRVAKASKGKSNEQSRVQACVLVLVLVLLNVYKYLCI